VIARKREGLYARDNAGQRLAPTSASRRAKLQRERPTIQGPELEGMRQQVESGLSDEDIDQMKGSSIGT
jgi:hypothetical protein